MKRPTAFINSIKLPFCFESLISFYTANLFLPLARLALITFRPLFVFILARKPWVLLRLVLWG